MHPSLFIATWLLANLVLVGAWDVYAVFFLGPGDTVSFWLQKWMRAFPVLGVALGILMGHLAWPVDSTIGPKIGDRS